MKSPLIIRSKGSSGFTLVELLVVIGIIAILAGVLFAVGGSAIRAAQRARASQIANSIQTAALNYYTEYNAYPVPSGTTGDYLIADTDTADWTPWLEALCGNINPSTPSSTPLTGLAITNSRNIAFMTIKASDLVTGTAAPKNPITPTTTQTTFNLALDSDYDGIVGDSGTAAGKLIDFVNSKVGSAPVYLANGTSGGVAVWADCNTVASSSGKWNPGFVVHTY